MSSTARALSRGIGNHHLAKPCEGSLTRGYQPCRMITETVTPVLADHPDPGNELAAS
jgi:hypothetical protein